MHTCAGQPFAGRTCRNHFKLAALKLHLHWQQVDVGAVGRCELGPATSCNAMSTTSPASRNAIECWQQCITQNPINISCISSAHQYRASVSIIAELTRAETGLHYRYLKLHSLSPHGPAVIRGEQVPLSQHGTHVLTKPTCWLLHGYPLALTSPRTCSSLYQLLSQVLPTLCIAEVQQRLHILHGHLQYSGDAVCWWHVLHHPGDCINVWRVRHGVACGLRGPDLASRVRLPLHLYSSCSKLVYCIGMPCYNTPICCTAICSLLGAE